MNHVIYDNCKFSLQKCEGFRELIHIALDRKLKHNLTIKKQPIMDITMDSAFQRMIATWNSSLLSNVYVYLPLN